MEEPTSLVFFVCTVSKFCLSRETHTVCFFDCTYVCVSRRQRRILFVFRSHLFRSSESTKEKKKNWEKPFENNWMIINNNNCTCHGCHNICLYFKLVFSIYIIYRLLKRVYCIYIYGVNKIERYYPRKKNQRNGKWIFFSKQKNSWITNNDDY